MPLLLDSDMGWRASCAAVAPNSTPPCLADHCCSLESMCVDQTSMSTEIASSSHGSDASGGSMNQAGGGDRLLNAAAPGVDGVAGLSRESTPGLDVGGRMGDADDDDDSASASAPPARRATFRFTLAATSPAVSSSDAMRDDPVDRTGVMAASPAGGLDAARCFEALAVVSMRATYASKSLRGRDS